MGIFTAFPMSLEVEVVPQVDLGLDVGALLATFCLHMLLVA